MPRTNPQRIQSKAVVKTVPYWPEGAKEQLQDCLETTDWNICVQDNLEDYTFTVLFYIRRCVENVNIQARSFPNQKPWFNRAVQMLLKERNKASKSGNAALYTPPSEQI